MGNYKHGLRNHWLYQIHQNMMKRCYDKNRDRYDRYGGRGIKVCERWHDIRYFVEDLEHHDSSLSIERIDVNGDYCPENVTFIPMKDQARNRSNNTIVEYEGELMTLVEASERSGISYVVLRMRKFREGITDRFFREVRRWPIKADTKEQMEK